MSGEHGSHPAKIGSGKAMQIAIELRKHGDHAAARRLEAAAYELSREEIKDPEWRVA